jgi:hypothetical protein
MLISGTETMTRTNRDLCRLLTHHMRLLRNMDGKPGDKTKNKATEGASIAQIKIRFRHVMQKEDVRT